MRHRAFSRFRVLRVTLVTVAVLAGSASLAQAAPAGHSARCSWPTDHSWFYSSTYDEAIYYVGHYVTRDSKTHAVEYWRQFADYEPAPWNHSVGVEFKHYSFKYCG